MVQSDDLFVVDWQHPYLFFTFPSIDVLINDPGF
jgi:hypothetical protein